VRDWVQQVFQPVVDHPVLEDALSGQPDRDSVLESHLRRLLDRGPELVHRRFGRALAFDFGPRCCA
jgi:hypothetical protein